MPRLFIRAKHFLHTGRGLSRNELFETRLHKTRAIGAATSLSQLGGPCTLPRRRTWKLSGIGLKQIEIPGSEAWSNASNVSGNSSHPFTLGCRCSRSVLPARGCYPKFRFGVKDIVETTDMAAEYGSRSSAARLQWWLRAVPSCHR